MKYFVTGASGWIGSAVVRELLAHGHDVTGLARSAGSADAIRAAGADAVRGSLDDPSAWAAGAADFDGVVHLGYNHDFSDMAGAAATDARAIATLGDALAGTGKPLLVASGVAGLTPGRPATEQDLPVEGAHPRARNARLALELAERGVRPVVVRFAPTVHGAGDHGFVAVLVGIARERGVSAYVGDGSGRWAAVHRDDAATLVRLALDAAPAGSVLHAVAEQGVATRAIAEAIGAGLGVPVSSIDAPDATEHFGWMGRFFGADFQAASDRTRRMLGWEPTGPTLLEDLATGSYFAG